jgi:hypothetical protein
MGTVLAKSHGHEAIAPAPIYIKDISSHCKNDPKHTSLVKLATNTLKKEVIKKSFSEAETILQRPSIFARKLSLAILEHQELSSIFNMGEGNHHHNAAKRFSETLLRELKIILGYNEPSKWPIRTTIAIVGAIVLHNLFETNELNILNELEKMISPGK